MTNKTPVSTTALSDEQRVFLIQAIVRDVAEIPDRNSPDEWPEAMIVTDKELWTILEARLPAAQKLPAASPALQEVADAWATKTAAKEDGSMLATGCPACPDCGSLIRHTLDCLDPWHDAPTPVVAGEPAASPGPPEPAKWPCNHVWNDCAPIGHKGVAREYCSLCAATRDKLTPVVCNCKESISYSEGEWRHDATGSIYCKKVRGVRPTPQAAPQEKGPTDALESNQIDPSVCADEIVTKAPTLHDEFSKEHNRRSNGLYLHRCAEWDEMVIDSSCKEFDVCLCFPVPTQELSGERVGASQECEGEKCWYNSETGYTEYCRKHEAVIADKAMESPNWKPLAAAEKDGSQPDPTELPEPEEDGFDEWIEENRVHMEGEDDTEKLMHVAWHAALRVHMVASQPELARNGEQESAIALVRQERRRQIETEGWSLEHDDKHVYGTLAKQAAALAVKHTDAFVTDDGADIDPWGLAEKHRGDAIRSLVISGALIVAEIERLQRAAIPAPKPLSEEPTNDDLNDWDNGGGFDVAGK